MFDRHIIGNHTTKIESGLKQKTKQNKQTDMARLLFNDKVHEIKMCT